jgi:hypothetical protein
LVDNLEDGNLTDFFGGTWAGYGWNGGTFNDPPAIVTPGANGTSKSVEETGSNTSSTGVNGFGVLATLSSVTGGTANLSNYFQGLSFYVKASQAATLRVEIASSNDQASGNTDYYGSTFTVGTSFQQVMIPASAFATLGYGTTGTFSSELQNALQIQWQTQNSAYPSGMSFWVDEVCIQTNNPPSPIPTSTPTKTITPTVTFTPTPGAPGSMVVFASLLKVAEPSRTPTVTPTITETPSPSVTPTPVIANALLSNVVAAPNLTDGQTPVRFLFTLGESAKVKLSLFTITGEEVYKTQVQGQAGNNSLVWPLENQGRQAVASGLYFYVLQIESGTVTLTRTGKIAVIK